MTGIQPSYTFLIGGTHFLSWVPYGFFHQDPTSDGIANQTSLKIVSSKTDATCNECPYLRIGMATH